MKQSGKCKLCGKDGILTYEHVPPRNAHNKNRFYIFPSETAIKDPFLEKTKGRQAQGGIGYYALCESCNNKTGAWYGKAYIDFVNQAVYRLRLATNQYGGKSPFVIHPLKVLKQVISFFVAIGAINYAEHYPELTKFVLDKKQNALPNEYQVYMYYNNTGRCRYIADNVVFNAGTLHKYSEIAFFPFGFVLSLKKTGVPIDHRQTEITSWKNFTFESKEWLTVLPLQPLDIEIAMYPGDYRSRKEIEDCISASIEDINADGKNF